MREILFRGKPINKSDGANSWIEGFYTKSPSGRTRILTTYNARPIEVIPETVGQFIGLYDINNKPIFEGDIVRTWGGTYMHGIYEFNEIEYVKDIRQAAFELSHCENVEIIGNIFDHPHLLKEGVHA